MKKNMDLMMLHIFFFREGLAEYFFRKGKARQWENDLTNYQIKNIEKNFRSTMNELNYL